MNFNFYNFKIIKGIGRKKIQKTISKSPFRTATDKADPCGFLLFTNLGELLFLSINLTISR